MALKLVAHVAECFACSAFVRELRTTQALVDSLQMPPAGEMESAEVVPIESERKRPWAMRPQWAVGLAALLVITLGIWFGTGSGASVSVTNDLRDGELFIRLEEDKGRMSEERFVALVSEILRADRRYQREMYVVLDEIAQNRPSGELRMSDTPNSADEEDDTRGRESSSPFSAAME
jgi:hypothetical protein